MDRPAEPNKHSLFNLKVGYSLVTSGGPILHFSDHFPAKAFESRGTLQDGEAVQDLSVADIGFGCVAVGLGARNLVNYRSYAAGDLGMQAGWCPGVIVPNKATSFPLSLHMQGRFGQFQTTVGSISGVVSGSIEESYVYGTVFHGQHFGGWVGGASAQVGAEVVLKKHLPLQLLAGMHCGRGTDLGSGVSTEEVCTPMVTVSAGITKE